MTDRNELKIGEWLKGEGPDSDIVISSRIRTARNVLGFPLKARLSDEEAASLCEHLQEGVGSAGLPSDMDYVSLPQLDEVQRLVLVEKRAISLEHANAEGERAVVCNEEGALSIMLNEEDHLRLQVISSGLKLGEIFEKSRDIEARLENALEFAYHSRFGYMTSCPTNVGTGMRISVMFHLPALVFTKQIDKVFNSVAKMNLAVRGFYGEGTKALSDFYQISNQVTLGKTPDGLLEDVRRVVPKIISFEREIRKQVLEGDRVLLEDRVCRALGVLGFARSISSEEAFEKLSMVRMGIQLELIKELDIQTVNRLFTYCQPGHLQAAEGGNVLESAERNVVRANFIREALGT